MGPNGQAFMMVPVPVNMVPVPIMPAGPPMPPNHPPPPPPPPAGGPGSPQRPQAPADPAAGKQLLKMLNPTAGSPTVAEIEAHMQQASVSSEPAAEEQEEAGEGERQLVGTGEVYEADEGLPVEDAEEENLVNE